MGTCMKRVAAYCRVSTDNADQANSYQSQVSYFREYIQRHEGWRLAGIYADEGISGTSTKKRDEFNRMLSDAENGLIDQIITKEVSRFARNTVDALQYTRNLKKLGIGVLFVNDNIDTLSGDGELRLSIMASIAQEESRKTSDRVKWGQKRRMEQGVVFGRDMLGYNVRGGKLELEPQGAEIVKLVFQKFTDEGKGAHVIARELREAGIRPMNVQAWSNTVILRLLRNEKYVGDLCQKKTYTPDFLDHGKKYNVDAEEKVYIRDHHPEIAIISRELWDRTQAEMKRRAMTSEQKRKHSNRYWCSGKLSCGCCGSSVVSRAKKLKNGTIYKKWCCFQAVNHGKPKLDEYGQTIGCEGAAVADKTLRCLVAYAVGLVQVDKERIKRELVTSISRLFGSQKPVGKAVLQGKINQIQAKKLRLIDLATSGTINPSDLKSANLAYDEEIRCLENQMQEADREAAVQKKQKEEIDAYVRRIDDLLCFNPEDEECLESTLDRAVIGKGSVDIYLTCVRFGFRLRYETSGRMENFQVKVLDSEVINC